jgi:hypothetical protein
VGAPHSWETSGTLTAYRLDAWSRNISLRQLQRPDQLWGTLSLLPNEYQVFSPIRWPEREADCTLISDTEVKLLLVHLLKSYVCLLRVVLGL